MPVQATPNARDALHQRCSASRALGEAYAIHVTKKIHFKLFYYSQSKNMSQKTNPTSLRLQKKNQNFSSPWFNDFYFTENYHYEFEIEKYLAVFLRETKYSKAFFSGKNAYRNFSVFLFIQDMYADKKEKQDVFKYKSFGESNKQNSIQRPVNSHKNYSLLQLSSVLQNISSSDKKTIVFEKENTVAAWIKKNFCVLLQPQEKVLEKEHWVHSFQNYFSNKERFSRFLQVTGFSSKKIVLPKKIESETIRKHTFPEREKEIYSTDGYVDMCTKNLFSVPCQKKVYEYDNGDSKPKETVHDFLFFLENNFPRESKNIMTLSFRKDIRNRFLKVQQNYLPFTADRKIHAEMKIRSSQSRDKQGAIPFLKSKALKKGKPISYSFSQKHEKGFPFFFKPSNKRSESLCAYAHHKDLGWFFNEKTFAPTKIQAQPVRFIRDRQNAQALVDQIITLLEKRISFRQIKSNVFKLVSEDLQIKGVRISCSGRLGGRSKKAQKAKMQCDSWGETSLNTFSSKLLFTSRSAFTPYGKVGIKLWLCYKKDRC